MLAFSLPIASMAIAIGASLAALWLFFRLREGQSLMRLVRVGAAFVMRFSIS